MPLPMPSASSDFELAPAGAHIAVCYRVIDLGTQPTTWQGNTRYKHLILISWELPDELMRDERPFTIGKRYTYSSHAKAALRQDLESWRGKAFTDDELGKFDIGRLTGAGCMLNVVHDERDGRTYANIVSIMRLPRNTPTPHHHNPSLCFSLADRPFDHAAFGTLSQGLQDIIKRAPEYAAAIEGRDPNEKVEPPAAMSEEEYGAGRPLDDDIPFITNSVVFEPYLMRKRTPVV